VICEQLQTVIYMQLEFSTKGKRKLTEEIIIKVFQNLMKTIYPLTQVQWTSSTRTQRKTLTCIISKLLCERQKSLKQLEKKYILFTKPERQWWRPTSHQKQYKPADGGTSLIKEKMSN
jgi:hypothetical protein